MSLALDRASLNELNDTQRETERALSELRNAIAKWDTRVDQVRTELESKLDITLTEFERVARESVENAISLHLKPFTMVRAIQQVAFRVFER